MKIIVILACAVAAFASQIPFTASFRPVRYDDHVLVRVIEPVSDLINDLAAGYDVWGGQPESHLDVFMSAQEYQDFKDHYPSAKHDILQQNMQALIDAESTRLLSASSIDKDWFQEYHPYAEIKEWYQGLAEEYSDFLTFIPSIGKTHEKRDIFAVRLTAPSSSMLKEKKQIWFQSQIHAREWISGATVQYIVYHMLKDYGTDTQITSLLDDIEFIIVPIVNPDGYEYTWTTSRLWRKNRRDNGRLNGFGVDLNRNWNAHWEEDGGASRSTWSEVYKGPSVASEPETQALVEFFMKHQRIVGAIDFHSFSQLILRPLGYSTKKPVHEKQLKSVGDGMAQKIAQVHGKKYTSIASVGLYPTTGTASDWFYGEEVAEKFGHHVYGYTIELRPTSSFGAGGFVLPPDQIVPTGQEIYEAVKYFAKEVTENPLD